MTPEFYLSEIGRLFNGLVAAPCVLISNANPPEKNGVYAFSIDGEIVYIGEAAGSGGLYDRILRKHVAGDDSHALQKAFKLKFPERQERRVYIKNKISVQWIEIPDSLMVTAVEKFGVLVVEPRFNDAVTKRNFK
jgi:hypothetical protein